MTRSTRSTCRSVMKNCSSLKLFEVINLKKYRSNKKIFLFDLYFFRFITSNNFSDEQFFITDLHVLLVLLVTDGLLENYLGG